MLLPARALLLVLLTLAGLARAAAPARATPSSFVAGTFILPARENTLTLTSLRPEGAEVMDIREVVLRRVE